MCIRGMLIVTHIANLNLAATLVFRSFSDLFSNGVLLPFVWSASGWDIVCAYCHAFRSTVLACAYVEIFYFQCCDPTAHIQIDAI